MQKILLTLGAVLLSVSASFAALTQDANNCYLIGSEDELYEFFDLLGKNVSARSSCAKLTANIVVNKNVLKEDGSLNEGEFRKWAPAPFYGTFDGGNYSISGLLGISQDGSGMGLFGVLGNDEYPTEIKNLEIKDSYFKGGNNVGSLASEIDDSSKVNLTNVRNFGTVVGNNNVGGFVGLINRNSEVEIVSCVNEGNVQGKNFVGGFVGGFERLRGIYDSDYDCQKMCPDLNIERSGNKGVVVAESYSVGGLVGYGAGTVSASFNEGNITGNYNVGGLFGNAIDSVSFLNCYNTGYVLELDDSKKQDEEYEEDEFEGWGAVGGFVGLSLSATIVKNCLSAGEAYVEKVEYGGSSFAGNSYGKGTEISSSFYVFYEVIDRYGTRRNLRDSYEGADAVIQEQLNSGVVAAALHLLSEEWGQQKIGEGGHPDLSGKVNADFVQSAVNLVTYEGDSNASSYPTEYLEGLGRSLPADVERDGFIFIGWFASENPVEGEKILTEITKDDVGEKTLYARFIQFAKPEYDGECYLISSTADLYGFASIVNGTNGMAKNNAACGKMTKNIIVNSGVINEKGELVGFGLLPWFPMVEFRGSFDGGGFAISGLYVNTPDSSNVGFIGSTERKQKASIRNLKILDSYFYGDAYVGAFIGFDNASETKIENCFTNSFVKGAEYVGGLVGISYGELDILKGYNTGIVFGADIVGGLVANGGILEIEDSYNEGPVFGETVGGFVGEADYSGYVYVANSYNAGNLSGEIVGGFVGYADGRPDIEIVNCYNLGDVPDGEYSGAFVGSTYGNIEGYISNCFTVIQGHLLGDKISEKFGYGIHFENVYYIAKDGIAAIVSGDEEDMEGLYAMKEADFYNGTVAKKLFDWIELDDKGIPVEDGADGGVWVVNSPDEKVLPQLDVNSKMRAVFLIAGENGKIADGKNVTMYEMGKSTPLPGAADVTRTGYTFAGWSVEKKGSRGIYAVPETQTGTAVFYARWKPKKYAVTVSVNDEAAGYVDGVYWSGNGDYEYDSEITLVALAEDGYHFTNWEDDVDAPMRRTIVVKETNVYKANFEKDVSSSSEQTPVPVAKSSSSSVVKSSCSSAMSSSSAKVSSSSSVKSSSSSAGKGGKSSSSLKKSEAVVANASVPHFSVSVTGRRLQVAGAKAGAVYALCDFHGRILQQGVVYSANFNLEARTAGRFILRIGYEIRQVNVR